MRATDASPAFEEWAFLEVMGHRRLAGLVSEAEIAGAKFLRIDVWLPDFDEPTATQYYGPQSVYCITPTTADVARAFAVNNVPRPVSRLELALPDRDEPY